MKSASYLAIAALGLPVLTACNTHTEQPTQVTATATANGEAPLPVVETVATMATRPGNLTVTPSGKILFTNSPLDAPSVKLAQLHRDGTSAPWPSTGFSAGDGATIRGAIGIRTDDAGTTWVLDMPTHTFYALDSESGDILKTIVLPDAVVLPTSFLQDFALDQKRGRAIIADMTQGDLKSAPQPAFIVVDLETGDAARVAENHPSMMPDVDGGFALNPITIDPEYDYVYFGALNGRTVYRVPAAAFDDGGAQVAANIERYGPKPFNDGMSVDGSGNVYITDVESKGYGVTTTEGYRLIARLPEGQSWPDGLSFGNDGYVYGTVDQLDRSAALTGTETGTGQYLIVRFEPVAPGARGR